MKDENDNITQELFIEKPKLLKGKNNDFQRLHIEKLVKILLRNLGFKKSALS